jgi:hypothetical protein
MSSNAPDSGSSRIAKTLAAVPEVAIIAALLLFVPLLNDMGQTTTVLGTAVPTVILVTVFWILGVVGGGIFTFRRR